LQNWSLKKAVDCAKVMFAHKTKGQATATMILHQTIYFYILLHWSVLANFFSELVMSGALQHTPQHLLVKLSKRLDFTHLDQLADSYHHVQGPGAPAIHPSSRLMRAMLVKYLYKLSLRQTEERLWSDLLIRWFVGLALFEAAPDHTTLERFEMWLNETQHSAIFDEILFQIDQDFPEEHSHTQIGDTYAMRANAARQDLLPLLRKTCQEVMQLAIHTIPSQFEYALAGFDWTHVFGVHKEPIGFFMTEAQRAERLQQTVLAVLDLQTRLSRLLQDRPTQELPELRRRLANLQKIIGDEVSVQDQAVQRLPSEKQGSYRIGSATDPEATYRKHGQAPEDTTFGYNVQVAVSSSGFVRATQAYTGAFSDRAGVAALIRTQKERQGFYPPKLIYDQAAGCGKTRAEVQVASTGQTLLVARLPPYEKRSELFGPYDFTLSADGQSLTCPNGKSTSVAYPAGGGEGRDFRFYPFQCWQGELPKGKEIPDPAQRCLLWAKCRKQNQGPRTNRKVFISTYRDQVQAAQNYNQTEAFQQEMKMRPKVERVIFELTNYYDARACRRHGIQNADWQARMCATAYNLKHWMRRLGMAWLPSAS
jgi:hypothetical protein